MRRALAILLAFSFSFPLLLPLVMADTASLPACCRRDGKHQCGMAARTPDTGQLAFTKGACSQFSASKFTVAERDDFLAAASGTGLSLAVAQAVQQDVQSSAYARFLRRESQRGPPALL